MYLPRIARLNIAQLGPFGGRILPRTARIPTCTNASSLANRSMASLSKAPSRLLSGEPNWGPPFIYGTAWKKERTKELVELALEKGFRRVDTAAQPRHYQEPLVGEGLREAYRNGVKREHVYVQTKYTAPAGQDLTNMPYNASDSLDTQVRTSIASSLKNLRPSHDTEEGSYIDCLLLHSPLPTLEHTLDAWNILESYVPDKIRTLGISNVTLPILKAIHDQATIKPLVVQNRLYPQTRYDGPLRAFCNQHGIEYQSFWTLTGNPRLLESQAVTLLAQSAEVSKSVALYALVIDQGVVVLNGTTSAQHMEDDLTGVRRVREWAFQNETEWTLIRQSFRNNIEPSAT